MRKAAVIGVGQSAFVRNYPGSIRELAFEGFKEAVNDAGITAKDIDASVFCSAPEYDKQRVAVGRGRRVSGAQPAADFLCGIAVFLVQYGA